MHWEPLAALTNTLGKVQLIDLPSTNCWRFYRAVSIPSDSASQDLVWIPPGTFTMGSPDNEQGSFGNEDPQTQVTISTGFWISKYEVTQENYLGVTGQNPSHFSGDLRHPVETVTWEEAVDYCAKLTVSEQNAGRLPAGYAYRLPSEAEWEYACRAGTTTRLFYGNDAGYTEVGEYAWYGGNSGNQTRPVGLKAPNKWGLYDMSGNVWEWCSDCYGPYPGGNVIDPQGPPSGTGRVIRGGYYGVDARGCRVAHRGTSTPTAYYNSGIGFRVVLAVVQ